MTMEFMQAPLVGQALRTARRDAGLTQAQLGAAVGVTASAVGQWESEATMPSWHHVNLIRKALGLPEEVESATQQDQPTNADLMAMLVALNDTASNMEAILKRLASRVLEPATPASRRARPPQRSKQ